MATTLQVILQSDVDNVGKSGELVKVRPGFARNFLIPRSLAVPATTAAINRITHEKAVVVATACSSSSSTGGTGSTSAQVTCAKSADGCRCASSPFELAPGETAATSCDAPSGEVQCCADTDSAGEATSCSCRSYKCFDLA